MWQQPRPVVLGHRGCAQSRSGAFPVFELDTWRGRRGCWPGQVGPVADCEPAGLAQAVQGAAHRCRLGLFRKTIVVWFLAPPEPSRLERESGARKGPLIRSFFGADDEIRTRDPNLGKVV